MHLIINCDSVLYQSSLVQGIVKDSQLAGIHLHLNLHEMQSEGESPSPNLIVMSATGARPFIRLQPNLSDDQLKTAYVLFDEADNAIVLLEQNEAFCFYKDPDTHYYDAFLSFLERLISDVDLTLIFQEFRQQLHKCPPVFNDPPAFSDDTQRRPLADTFTYNRLFAFCKRIKKKLFISVFSLLLGVSITSTFFDEKHTLRSELSLPKKSILLNRPLLEKQMRLVMHAQTGIKKIVLVGIGGSGKTTAARMYARSEKAKIIWELNAETRETLIHSLTDLSHALAHTKEKKEELAFIQKTTNIKERDNQIVMFVKNQLKQNSDWVLIYDNVDNLSTIIPYLPQDIHVWGRGKVLITTRNANAKNCFYINTNEVVPIRELNEGEKNKLFSMIVCDGDPVSRRNNKPKTLSFLKELPSFPLDILTAAYYIKATNISREAYVSGIKNLGADFVTEQESLLVDTCLPAKTRYGIISLTLTKLIQENPLYKELLFFISMMNSHDIPKKMLSVYLNNVSIEPFMHALRKQSFITHEGKQEDGCSSHYFSFHRSVQESTFIFFEKAFTPETMVVLMTKLVDVIASFVHSDLTRNHEKMIRFIPHMEAMVTTIEKLSIPTQEKERYKQQLFFLLGYAHYKSTHDLQLAKQYFLKVDAIQRQMNTLDKKSMALLLKDMGEISVLLNNLKDVLGYCERSMALCAHIPQSELLVGDNLRIIGSYYRKIDNVEKAKQYYESALDALKTSTLEDRKGLEAEIYTQLSFYYNNSLINQASLEGVRYAKKALEVSQASRMFRNTPKNKPNTLSCAISKYKWMLGQAYSRIGKYKNALDEGFLEARYVMEKADDNCASDLLLKGRIAEGVGEAHLREGDFAKSTHELTEAIRIYERLLGSFTTLSARVYRIEALIQLGKLDKAYQECLDVFSLERRESNQHLDMIDATANYHAAVIKYKQHDFEKAALYLAEFMTKAQKICKNVLDDKTYKALAVKGVFLHEVKKNITTPKIWHGFNKCTEIFMALYSASGYGSQHPFLTRYVNTFVMNN